MQTLTQAVTTAKTIKELHKDFCFKAQDTRTELLNKDYFTTWARENITLPDCEANCKRFVFKPFGSEVMTPRDTLLIPTHLNSLVFSGAIQPEITKISPRRYRLSFTHHGSRKDFNDLVSYNAALEAFKQFKLSEVLAFCNRLKTDYEKSFIPKLIKQFIGPEYLEGDIQNKGHFFPTKEQGRQSWQYTCWLGLMSSVNKATDENNIRQTLDGKFISSQLLDYQRFYPLINQVKSRCFFEKPLLVVNFFDDIFINSTSLVYLPKRFIKNYEEYQTAEIKKFDSSKDNKYRVQVRDHLGVNKHLGYFPTLEEAREAYRVFKLNVVKELFNYYRPHICPDFCSRFQQHLENLAT